MRLMVHQNLHGTGDVTAVAVGVAGAVAGRLPLSETLGIQLLGVGVQHGTLADAHAADVGLGEMLVTLRGEELILRAWVLDVPGQAVFVLLEHADLSHTAPPLRGMPWPARRLAPGPWPRCLG